MSFVFPAPAAHPLSRYPDRHADQMQRLTYPMQPQHARRARRPPALERVVRQEPVAGVLGAALVLQVVVLLVWDRGDPAEDLEAVGVWRPSSAMSSGGILFLFFLFFFFFSSCSYSSSPPSSSCTSSLLLLFFSLPCGWSVISETLLSILMMGFSSSSRMARRLSVWAADSGRQRGFIIESRYKEIKK